MVMINSNDLMKIRNLGHLQRKPTDKYNIMLKKKKVCYKNNSCSKIFCVFRLQ